MLIHGKCHCGNISFSLTWEPDPGEIPARACTCSFCTKHGGVWTSLVSGLCAARADMESASTDAPIVATGKCVRTATLPARLSASVGAGVTRGAMVGDQSLASGGGVSGRGSLAFQAAIGKAVRAIFFSGRRTSP